MARQWLDLGVTKIILFLIWDGFGLLVLLRNPGSTLWFLLVKALKGEDISFEPLSAAVEQKHCC